MKSSKRIISFILAFATGFSLYALPASADYISSENFGSWVTRNSPEFIQRWTHGFFGAGCTVSEDGRHHASSFQTDLGTGYYDCICSECGHSFRAYYQDSYDQSVSELPSSVVSSDGSIIWYPEYDYSYLRVYFGSTQHPDFFPVGHSNYIEPSLTNNDFDDLYDIEFLPHHLAVTHKDGGRLLSPSRIQYIDCYLPIVPISGVYYKSLTRSSISYVDLNSSGLSPRSHEFSSLSDPFSFDTSGSSYSAGQSVTIQRFFDYNLGGSRFLDTLEGYVEPLCYKIIPTNPLDLDSGDTYNIDNRVGSLVGNYTYEGDNGTQVIAEDIRIVNETDQSVYNPVTNETYYYNEYTYNYGDRSYDFSFGDRDDHVSVTYGDDCVTIEDGDHTYTIYYTTASNHEHSYRITNVIDPTCTEQGKIYKSCSECGDELIDFTDALGHDWQITEQTAVDYVLPEARCPACESQYFTYELVDEVFYCVCHDCGEEWSCNADVMEGHTTYTCSRCGEERTETNQEQDLSLFEAIGDLLADTFEWITDKLGQFINSLSGLSESFSSRIESIIESVGNYPLLFGAFLAGMPDDLMNIVWFGVIALVFVLVWKKFFS